MIRVHPLPAGLPLVASFLGLSLGLSSQADSFSYQRFDLIAGFRQDGASYEVAVNLGSLTNYLAVPPGGTLTVDRYSVSQLTTAFPSFQNLQWSVSGTVYGGVGTATYPVDTLWLTRARSDVAVPTDPWVRKSALSQSQAASRVYTFAGNSVNYGAQVAPDPVQNTATVIIVPAGDPLSYSQVVGLGNWQGTFQGNVEVITPGDFDGAVVSRADLYEMVPEPKGGSGDPATLLGYFDLHGSGILTFTRAGATQPAPIPTPQIVATSRNGSVTTISFSTTNDPTAFYTLRFTNLAGVTAPLAQWGLAAVSVPGDGRTNVLADTSAEASRVYVVQATR